jgi:integrase
MQPMDAQSWSVRLRELARDARVFGENEQRYERVSGHSLRRGFVTSALLAGHDPVTVAKQTRHRNITMISTYADELALLNGTDWATVHFGDPVMLGGEMGER